MRTSSRITSCGVEESSVEQHLQIEALVGSTVLKFFYLYFR